MSDKSTRRPTGAVTSLGNPPQLTPDGIIFKDRRDAGRHLAALLEPVRGERPVVIGIARGGVPVAAEVARVLRAPLDVAVVRKIGAPQNPEFAIGALAEGNVHVLSANAVRGLRLDDAAVGALIARAEGELTDRLRRYRGTREPLDLNGRTAIVVDDGLATGRTALAAVRSLRRRGASRVILAAPVAAPESARALRPEADAVVCAQTPRDLWAVGYWYEDFGPTSDEEVAALLAENRREVAGAPRSSEIERAARSQVSIPVGAAVALSADLMIPSRARGSSRSRTGVARAG